MTTCSGWLERLSAMVDGALAEDERSRAEAHLAACTECQQRLRSLRALKHAVARLPSRETPPGAVRAHVESLALRNRARNRVGRLVPIALATSLIGVTWALLSHHERLSPSVELADALATDHLHSVPEALPAEVVTDDPGQAIRFFSGRLPFSPVAPKLPGARLLGGRLCKIQGERVQLLFYRAPSDATLSLFVSDRVAAGDGCREARGLQVCSRRAFGLTLLAVGSDPPEKLRRLLDGAELDER